MNIPPMPPRTVASIGAACLTTGWLLASVLSPPVADLQTLPGRREAQTRPEVDTTSGYAEQLHLRLQQAPPAPVPRRNPFAFVTPARRVAVASVEGASADAAPGLPAPPSVVGPLLTLSGIGTTEASEGTMRTAVVSDGQTVHLIRVGETVGGYTVVDVAEDAVVLADATGAQWRLRLK